MGSACWTRCARSWAADPSRTAVARRASAAVAPYGSTARRGSPVSPPFAASPAVRSPRSKGHRRSCATAGLPRSSSTEPVSAGSAHRASCCGWPASKRRGRGGHRRAGTSRLRCAPTCAGARVGSRLSRPRAVPWVSTGRRPRRRGIRATLCGPPGGPRWRGRPSRPPGPTWSSAVAGSPTIRHRRRHGSSWGRMQRWPPTCARRVPPAGACRAATARSPSHTRSHCLRASGRSRCRRRGSSRRMSSRTPAGPGPAISRPPRWPTAAHSGASGAVRFPRSGGSSPTRPGKRSASCGDARTSYDVVPSARPWRSLSDPMARGWSASDGRKLRPTSNRWRPNCGRATPASRSSWCR